MNLSQKTLIACCCAAHILIYVMIQYLLVFTEETAESEERLFTVCEVFFISGTVKARRRKCNERAGVCLEN